MNGLPAKSNRPYVRDVKALTGTEQKWAQLVQRFWSKVDTSNPDGCWLWKGSLFRAGMHYGSFSFGTIKERNKTRLNAHRVSYEINIGPIPAGLIVCHKCDCPPCVRPDHLFLGTPKDNIRDAVRKGRMASGPRNGMNNPVHRRHWYERLPRGEQASNHRLTAAQVANIRFLVTSGIPFNKSRLARTLGVSFGAVHDVVIGSTWR